MDKDFISMSTDGWTDNKPSPHASTESKSLLVLSQTMSSTTLTSTVDIDSSHTTKGNNSVHGKRAAETI
jgi:hypothetical protein